MTIDIKHVLMWLKLDGAYHALASTGAGSWHFTLCGTFTPDGDLAVEASDEICPKCRDLLAVATVVGGRTPPKKWTNNRIRGPSTPKNPRKSKLMLWIRDHLNYEGDDCLIWPFGRCKDGYGMIGRSGTMTTASRYICEAVHGAPPTESHQAAHSCGRGHDACVHPQHLSWKTPQENQLDRTDFSRKLTDEQADEIRSMAGVERPADTAARFGIRESTVWQIQTGKLHPRTPDLTQPTGDPAA